MIKIIIASMAVICVALLLIFSGILPLSFGRISINPNTQRHWQLGDRIVGNYDVDNDIKYELITNPVGGTRYRSAFLLAKTPNGESEFITANGQMWYGRGLFDYLLGTNVYNSGWYVIKHRSPGDLDWRVIADDTGNKVNWINYNNARKQEWITDGLGFWHWGGYLKSPVVFSILGEHPGAIRIELQTKVRDHWFNAWETRTLASDEAEILPSGGLIERTQDRATYEVGEVMEMRISTDFSGSTVGEQSRGYVVKIRSPDGDVVWSKDLQDDWDGTIKVTIEEDWYDPDWSNRFQVELVNQMRGIGVVSFYAIDVLGKAPANCDISTTIVKGKIEAGSSLPVTFTAPEKVGASTIESFEYCMFFGQSSGSTEPPSDSSAWIEKWKKIDAEKTGDIYTATVSISLPNDEGYATILGVSIGEGNRASEIITPYGLFIWVGDEPDDDQLDDDNLGQGDAYRGGRTTNWYDWILPPEPKPTDEDGINWLGVTIAVFIILGFALIGFLVFKDPKMIIVCVIGGMVVAVLVYVLFFTTLLGSFIG